jgi:hypothetical protein
MKQPPRSEIRVKVYHMKFTRYPEILSFPQDFELVAVVEAGGVEQTGQLLERAWHLTNSIEAQWDSELTRLSGSNIHVVGNLSSHRSSQVGDVFEIIETLFEDRGNYKILKREQHQVDSFGFKPLGAGAPTPAS